MYHQARLKQVAQKTSNNNSLESIIRVNISSHVCYKKNKLLLLDTEAHIPMPTKEKTFVCLCLFQRAYALLLPLKNMHIISIANPKKYSSKEAI